MGCTVHGDLIEVYPKPYSIYLRGTIDPGFRLGFALGARGWPRVAAVLWFAFCLSGFLALRFTQDPKVGKIIAQNL